MPARSRRSQYTTPAPAGSTPGRQRCNNFDVEEDSITPETNLADDLGADSLDVVDMLMSLEDEFDVEIPDEEIERIRTVGELVAYIEENM